jgi:hypothetical protein
MIVPMPGIVPGRRQQLVAQHALEADDAIVVGQELVAQLTDEFGFEFERQAAWRCAQRCRAFEDVHGLGLQDNHPATAFVGSEFAMSEIEQQAR